MNNFINTSPDDKILALSKRKASIDKNFIVTEIVQFLLGRLEKIVEEGENSCCCFYCMLHFIQVGNNYLPNDKILDWSILKAFGDDKLKVTKKMKFVLEMVENMVGKGENAGYQHF